MKINIYFLSKGIILLHNTCTQITQKLGWEVLLHVPYSPDHTVRFFLFASLKESLRSVKFSKNEQVKKGVLVWLKDQGEQFFTTGIEKLTEME